MEFTLGGNALKTFARSITCLARIGNELAIQASSTQLTFHTLNSSRSAYQSITFKPDFFDVFTVFGPQMQCSVLLKAICSILRTPIASIDHLSVSLPNPDASKGFNPEGTSVVEITSSPFTKPNFPIPFRWGFAYNNSYIEPIFEFNHQFSRLLNSMAQPQLPRFCSLSPNLWGFNGFCPLDFNPKGASVIKFMSSRLYGP
ncbi:radiation sensitive protein rad9 [Datura stramonium]|uniref:Radiation sensitive protein rad9 n=1 Tax=Datura stramonium TaxID=4076 RepID=A0ABS8SSQ4_DATST|nr:radiation sensitive protein rad9 [Datura stramonium]